MDAGGLRFGSPDSCKQPVKRLLGMQFPNLGSEIQRFAFLSTRQKLRKAFQTSLSCIPRSLETESHLSHRLVILVMDFWWVREKKSQFCTRTWTLLTC